GIRTSRRDYRPTPATGTGFERPLKELFEQIVDRDEVDRAEIQLQDVAFDRLAIANDDDGHLVGLNVLRRELLQIRGGDLVHLVDEVRIRVRRQVIDDEIFQFAREVTSGLELTGEA